MNTRTTINPNFEKSAAELDDFVNGFDMSGETVLSGRNTVKRFITKDGTKLIVKRFGKLAFLRRIIYSTVCRSKARRAYDNGLRFISLGFDSPEPVACIESYKRGLLSDSYFISLQSDATAAFADLVKPDRFDCNLADAVAELMARLHAAGAVHGDPNLNNILYSKDKSGKINFSLIDTNRSFFRTGLSHRTCMKNLMRVTHRRDLMRQIAGHYAVVRGLDPVKTVDKIFNLLQRFERNRRIRHRIKSFILRRPVD